MGLQALFLFEILTSFVVLSKLRLVHGNGDDHWFFLHYHKTGHDLTRLLAKVFEEHPCSARVSSYVSRKDARLGKDALPRKDITYSASAEMNFNWHSGLYDTLNTPARIKYVHFLRDPVDLIISATLYHAQNPPPPEEGYWLTAYHFIDPCAFEMWPARTYTDKIAKFNNLSSEQFYNENIMGLERKCQELLNEKRNVYEHGSYGDLLRAFLPDRILDAMLIETARTTLRDLDMLRMGANSLYQRSSADISTRVFSSDLPSGDIDTLRHTLTRLFTFLMSDDEGVGEDVEGGRDDRDGNPFWSCIDIPTAVERALKLLYINPEAAKSNKHITRDLISGEERTRYAVMLRDYPVAGPIFAAVNATLHSLSPSGEKVVLM